MVAGFWQQVLDSDMAVPDERPLNELTAELVGMLGSTNPVERDEIAYPVLATWVGRGRLRRPARDLRRLPRRQACGTASATTTTTPSSGAAPAPGC